MAVRKRIWKTNGGESREAWVVDYTDQAGERHIETFDRKKDADARHADVKIDVKKGIHVAAGKTVTVAEAATRWIEAAEVDLERATAKTYREHVRLHVVPYIGRLRLSDMSVPMVSKFRDTLRQEGRSPDMVPRVLVSLGSIIADAQDHGLVAHNAVRELRRNRKRGKDRQAELRRKGKLKVGKDIPTPDEISLIFTTPRLGGGRSYSWRPTPACGPLSFVGCAGRMSASRTASCTSGSEPTVLTTSGRPNRQPAIAPSPLARSWRTLLRSGSCAARMGNWCSQPTPAGSSSIATS